MGVQDPRLDRMIAQIERAETELLALQVTLRVGAGSGEWGGGMGDGWSLWSDSGCSGM